MGHEYEQSQRTAYNPTIWQWKPEAACRRFKVHWSSVADLAPTSKHLADWILAGAAIPGKPLDLYIYCRDSLGLEEFLECFREMAQNYQAHIYLQFTLCIGFSEVIKEKQDKFENIHTGQEINVHYTHSLRDWKDGIENRKNYTFKIGQS